ncbi:MULTISPECIES: gamma-glutamylcyclotransferase family protein [Calothrix]|uniref:Gamma-glutamylcyclotransferase n=2 Tax=Calothrix TaxID=1186 RepID=A0ABR8AAC5_9CYAN|nr:MULTISPECIES: gamma-glutamylcyclotransferase [Calothrix]MBD2196962.1 gamma-glutamylcyclotransferase [Calothrix parietina FACHB-288]MBD2225514.1 gamma-glutamylcyclotransferase [Calothrix anomala FACHB-343]
MTELKIKFSGQVRIFVYGTLKPGEVNYKRYCAAQVIDTKRAIAPGKLFALPMGYPAMTLEDSQVHGYLLVFADGEIFTQLDELEDYQPHRPTDENLYNRQEIEIRDLQGLSLGLAWVYFMWPQRVSQFRGIPQPDGWWSGCGLTADKKEL